MTNYEKSQEALLDWQEIVEYTIDQHGVDQTLKYTKQLTDCIESMASGIGFYKEIVVLGRKVRVKHCQKHYIFGLSLAKRPLLIIGFLHERMDLMTRLKQRLG